MCKLQNYHMKSLDETETPNFVLLGVLCFQGHYLKILLKYII